MLLALTDYICYRLGKGHYSPDAFAQQHAVLAIPENFPDLSRFLPGDIFFYHTRNSFISWIIMYYTNGIWSHTGTIAGGGRIIDATTSGVIEHPLSDYLDGNGYIAIKKIDITDAGREKMMAFMRQQLGKDFNWTGVLRLFLCIVFGAHAHYSVRYLMDFLLLAAAMWAILFWTRLGQMSIVFAVAAYLIIVILNTPKRISKRQCLAQLRKDEKAQQRSEPYR